MLLYFILRWQWHSKVNILSVLFSNWYLLILSNINQRITLDIFCGCAQVIDIFDRLKQYVVYNENKSKHIPFPSYLKSKPINQT